MEATMEKVHAGSNLPQDVVQAKPAEKDPKSGKQDPMIGGGSFSTYYTWRGSGVVNLNCGNGSINSNSRVFASISEYNTDPTLNRFIGSAPMSIANVAPYNGGVVVKLYVNWNGPINVRVDILVDP